MAVYLTSFAQSRFLNKISLETLTLHIDSDRSSKGTKILSKMIRSTWCVMAEFSPGGQTWASLLLSDILIPSSFNVLNTSVKQTAWVYSYNDGYA